MKNLIYIVRLDVLRRVRKYNFLVALAVSLAFSSVLIPGEDANYVTLRIGDGFIGYNNSAWIGLVNASMSILILAMVGFFYIHGSIYQDYRHKVSNLLAAYPISNKYYLFIKVLSNTCILLIIATIILVGVSVKDLLVPGNYPFVLSDLIVPFLVFVLPSSFIISSVAVAFEVLLRRKIVIQQVLYFFTLQLLSVFSISGYRYDFYGLGYIGTNLTRAFAHQVPLEGGNSLMSIGFLFSENIDKKYVLLDGIAYDFDFLFSRFIWVLIFAMVIWGLSYLFNRFQYAAKGSKEKWKRKKDWKTASSERSKILPLKSLPTFTPSTSNLPLLVSEIKMIVRNQNVFILLLVVIGLILQARLELQYVINMVVPVVWFLQVNHVAALFSKEYESATDSYFFVTYQSSRRLFLLQFFIGVMFLCLLALPAFVVSILQGYPGAAFSLLLAAFVVISLSAFFGVLTQQRRLSEIILFVLTYLSVSDIPLLDFLNWHITGTITLVIIVASFSILGVIAFFRRPA